RSSETIVMSRGREGMSKSGRAKGPLGPIGVTARDRACCRTNRRFCAMRCSELPAGGTVLAARAHLHHRIRRPGWTIRWHACAHALGHFPDVLQDRGDQALVVSYDELFDGLGRLELVDEDDLLVGGPRQPEIELPLAYV